jgi:hypothetical protein
MACIGNASAIGFLFFPGRATPPHSRYNPKALKDTISRVSCAPRFHREHLRAAGESVRRVQTLRGEIVCHLNASQPVACALMLPCATSALHLED